MKIELEYLGARDMPVYDNQTGQPSIVAELESQKAHRFPGGERITVPLFDISFESHRAIEKAIALAQSEGREYARLIFKEAEVTTPSIFKIGFVTL